MQKQVFIFSLTLLMFCQCKLTQNQQVNSLESSNKPSSKKIKKGECFAKCLISDQFKYKEKEYIVYTGNESEENVDVKVKEIILQKKSTQWVKKKTDRNCLSADPNDCLVWCLIEIPEKKKTLKILKDTTQTKNFERRKIKIKRLKRKGGYTEWRQVVCAENINESIIGALQNSLREAKYFEGVNTFKLDAKTKSALTKFQKSQNLPVGHLDFETLDRLGIKHSGRKQTLDWDSIEGK